VTSGQQKLMDRRCELITANSSKSKQPRILLVDDNEELRKAMGAVLGASKFQVTTASNVAEALHLIDTKPFDVLLTDLQCRKPVTASPW
jgi:DNA-binding NtrC family response regulator